MIKASNITHRPRQLGQEVQVRVQQKHSLDKFVQYSAGGAFVARSEYEGGTTHIYLCVAELFAGSPNLLL